MTIAYLAAAAVAVLGLAARAIYLAGYRAGHQDGADAMADEWTNAACAAPDIFDLTWPAERRAERLPS